MRHARSLHTLAIAGLAVALSPLGASCAAQEPRPAEPARAPSFARTTRHGCERLYPGVGPRPLAGARQGSSVALARTETTLLALVADHDEKRVEWVDVQKRRMLGSVELSGTPEQLLLLPDGRVVVSLADQPILDVLEPTPEGTLERACQRPVPVGGFGLALTADGQSITLTSSVEATLTVLDAERLEPRGIVPLPRQPRGVLVEGDHAFVAHAVGATLSRVDLRALDRPAAAIALGLRAATPKAQVENLRHERTGSQAYALASLGGASEAEGEAAAVHGAAPPPPTRAREASRIVVPMVSVDPGDTSDRTQFYYGPPPTAGVPKQAPVAVLIDPEGSRALSRHVVAQSEAHADNSCILPRAVVSRPAHDRLYVACLGLDAVLELDARAADPMRAELGRFEVGRGPTGLALSEADGVLVAAGQFDGVLSVIELATGTVGHVSLDVPVTAGDEDLKVGRDLFYRASDPRIAADGIACASCHPDGGDDGLTWITPEGPRQTIMLAGRLHGTAPYGWTRQKGELVEYIGDTSRRLGGRGLDPEDLKRLARFVDELPAPPERAGGDSALRARGEAAFRERGCASCHVGGKTDAHAHDVGSSTRILQRPNGTPYEGGEAIDTPSLVRVGISAPYYHDGRYATLEALLADPTSRMGETSRLMEDERRSIRAYLESL